MISRDVLGVYLKTALPSAPPEGITPELSNVLPPNSLVSTVVSKLPPIQSMQAFNLQLSVGGKDEALRKSASAFKSASQSMRRALASGERYWTDALRARNANWVLVPAPLPFGAMTRRSTDSNAMDLCISYGLEHGMHIRHSAAALFSFHV
jgi:mediator of RNA polymerase II transcription subunit 17